MTIACASCGYDIGSQRTDGACPECGETVLSSFEAKPILSPWLIRLILFHFAALLAKRAVHGGVLYWLWSVGPPPAGLSTAFAIGEAATCVIEVVLSIALVRTARRYWKPWLSFAVGVASLITCGSILLMGLWLLLT